MAFSRGWAQSLARPVRAPAMPADLLDPAGEWWLFIAIALSAPLLPALHLALVWWPRAKVSALRWAFVLYGLACVGLLLGVGPATSRGVLTVFSLWLTLCLGYLQVVSMVTRSISLRLLVELRERPGASHRDLFDGYAQGRGFGWLLEKRLAGLEHLGLIRRCESGLTATDRGVVLGRFTLVIKRLLALKETG